MNLIVDIGNTFTKIAIADNNGKIVFNNRYEILSIDTLSEILTDHSVKRAIISAVGKIDNTVVIYIKSNFPTIELDHTTNLPIANRYKTPETLGRDRIAAVVGANYLYPSSAVLVIDCGTAITYDLINSENQYLGGAISPGIKLRFKALNQHTANLPLVDTNNNFSLVGTSTVECIQSGVINGILGEIDNYINQIEAEYPTVIVVLTGGDSNFFVSKLKNSIFVVQNLVIIGLNRILDFNA